MSCRLFPSVTRLDIFNVVFNNCENACRRAGDEFVYAGFSNKDLTCYCATDVDYAASEVRPDSACSSCSPFSCEDNGTLLREVRQIGGREPTVTSTARSTTRTTTRTRTTTSTRTTSSSSSSSRSASSSRTNSQPTLPPVGQPSSSTVASITSMTNSSATGGSQAAGASDAPSSGVSTAAIAGAVIGGILVAVLLAVGIVAYRNRQRKAASPSTPPSWNPDGAGAAKKNLNSRASVGPATGMGAWFKRASVKPPPKALSDLLTPSTKVGSPGSPAATAYPLNDMTPSNTRGDLASPASPVSQASSAHPQNSSSPGLAAYGAPSAGPSNHHVSMPPPPLPSKDDADGAHPASPTGSGRMWQSSASSAAPPSSIPTAPETDISVGQNSSAYAQPGSGADAHAGYYYDPAYYQQYAQYYNQNPEVAAQWAAYYQQHGHWANQQQQQQGTNGSDASAYHRAAGYQQ
ncbi:hypothetical protein HDU96_004429 [Phlyctochytrium bullatum]|nr:hypothetical protein HDU96_004429 [Phlyctochytrium bullatum]